MSIVFEPDKSGINSLGGFSYQIKVFVYYLSLLKEEGMQLEFESFDDVSFSKINAEKLDEKSENFKSTIVKNDSIIAIQVKRTDITNETARQTLLNWFLLEASQIEVSRYILFTDAIYNNEDKMFDISCEDLFALVKATDKSTKSTIGKVKKYFKDDYESFKNIYESIESKYKFKVTSDLDEEIAKAYSVLLRKKGVSNEIIFFQRIKALLEKITSNILEKINTKDSFSITHDGFMKLIEHICKEISDDNPILDYMSFRRMCSIDVNDLAISNLREFKQLKSCELTIPLIEAHLTYGFYYEHYRLTNSELNKIIKIDNIEITAFDNYNEEIFALQRSKNDNPYNRLERTKNRMNSYADNEQIKYGVVIYLTKDNIGDKQISWEEE
ncbi:hypothetical protein [Metabacillus dongyingensis]|uniref:hypothetical protein n=1 Tax=Metabacillus dongyingensis TaxID=2874282 RepID=UPI001CBC97D6|nr:hypothetical protein [Metabacillus dongyingensis]UAL54471.1 hypothetical protein K8L98_12195 [Metabacillus dongyingensis]